MAERLKRVPLWYEAASAVTIASLVACQLGKKLGFVTPSPEGTKTGSTETVPPPTSTLEATSPANIQPMVEETPVSGATATPETTSPAVWAPPTLEQMAVTGYGGELSPDVVVYEFDKVIATGLARVGIENTKVNFSDNGLSGNDYFWAPLVTDSEGSVIWVYDPAIGQLEWPVKLDIVYDAQGLPFYSLHTEGLSYQAVPDSESAQIVWGGTKDGISGKYLAILAKDPITLPDGRQIYSTFWDRSSQSWLPTPGLAELLATPTPEAIIPLPDFSLDLLGTVSEEGASLTIPFTVGLMKDIMERSVEPIKSFYVNPERPDAPDKLAYYYLRMCWLNHKKNYPEHADISWTEYLGEVQAGRGLIKLALADPSSSSWDSPKKTVMSVNEISPLDGVTVIKADSLFGMKKLAGLYAVENNGRLIVVAHGLFPESFTEPPGKIQRSADFIAGGILPDIYLILGIDVNQALEYGYVGNGLDSLDLDFFNEYLKFMPDFYNYSNGSLSKPYFIIEQ